MVIHIFCKPHTSAQRDNVAAAVNCRDLQRTMYAGVAENLAKPLMTYVHIDNTLKT